IVGKTELRNGSSSAAAIWRRTLCLRGPERSPCLRVRSHARDARPYWGRPLPIPRAHCPRATAVHPYEAALRARSQFTGSKYENADQRLLLGQNETCFSPPEDMLVRICPRRFVRRVTTSGSPTAIRFGRSSRRSQPPLPAFPYPPAVGVWMMMA